jgi:hypothetical protein
MYHVKDTSATVVERVFGCHIGRPTLCIYAVPSRIFLSPSARSAETGFGRSDYQAGFSHCTTVRQVQLEECVSVEISKPITSPSYACGRHVSSSQTGSPAVVHSAKFTTVVQAAQDPYHALT